MHLGLITCDLSLRHGWAAYSIHLAKALAAQGVQITAITSRNSQRLKGVKVLPILPALDPQERGVLPKLLLALPRAAFALRGCDVIHAAVEPFAPLGALVAGNRPFVITGHGSYVNISQAWGSVSRPLYRWAFRQSRLTCVSQYTAEIAARELPGIKPCVINNGVDAEKFAHLPKPMPKDGPTVLSVGAVKARKGTLDLVRAMAEVRREIPNVQCVIIGSLTLETAYVFQVQAEIHRLGLSDSVHLLGRVDDATLRAWYATADVFALPSRADGWKFEGYGLALLEASAAGLPTIGTRESGASDAVDHEITGLLVSEAHLAAELPAAIIALLRDPERAAQMGVAGRAKAQQQTWAHIARQMMDFYSTP